MGDKLTKSCKVYRLWILRLTLSDQGRQPWRDCHKYLDALYREFGRERVRAELEKLTC